jgi:hypothetical protein
MVDLNDPQKWKNNGFKGAVKFIPFTGPPQLRPCRLEVDMYCPSFPLENNKPLNTSQLPKTIRKRYLELGSISVKNILKYCFKQVLGTPGTCLTAP